MRTKVLSLALIGALLALPVPPGQLARTFSTAASSVRMVPGEANLAILMADPARTGGLSFTPPVSFLETASTGVL